MRGSGRGASRQPPPDLQQRAPLAARLAHEDLAVELRTELNDKIADLQFHLQEKLEAEARLRELQSKLLAQLSEKVDSRFEQLQAQLPQKIGAEASARQTDIKAVRGEIGKRSDGSETFAGFFPRSYQHDDKATAAQAERLQQIEARMATLEEQSSTRQKWLEKLQEGILAEVSQSAQKTGVLSEATAQPSAELQSRLEALEQTFQGLSAKLESSSISTGVAFEDDARDLRPQVEELRRKCDDTLSKLGNFQSLMMIFSQKRPPTEQRPQQVDHVIQEPEPDSAYDLGNDVALSVSAQPARNRTAWQAGRDR